MLGDQPLRCRRGETEGEKHEHFLEQSAGKTIGSCGGEKTNWREKYHEEGEDPRGRLEDLM